MPLSEAEVVQLKEDILIQSLSDQEAIALDVSSEKYFEINEAAVALTALLQKGATKAQLADRLCTVFDVDRTDAARDVRQLVANLAQHNMLR